MEIHGKIIAVMPERGGVSQRGTEWKVQEFVLETHEQYPKKMVFEVFGADRLSRFNIQIGQELNVAFDIDAREWNGRWFNSIRAYDVRPAETVVAGANAGVAQATQSVVTSTASDQTASVVSEAQTVTPADDAQTDDLPF